MIAEKYEDLRASAGEYLNRGTEQVSHMVDERPAGVLLFSCLAGFAAGLLISRVLTRETGFASSIDSTTAERFGLNLLDKMEHLVPTMLRERFSR